jgi:hypothetical protein
MLPDGGIESGIRSRLQATLPVVLSVLLGALFASSGQAQQSLRPQATTAGAESLQDLAKDTLNPFAGFIKVPFQFTTGFGVGAYKRVGESLNIEPLLPFALNSDWDLIARPSLNVTYSPGPNEQFGFQDLQTSFFMTPAKDKTWIWDVGPIFQFPDIYTRRGPYIFKDHPLFRRFHPAQFLHRQSESLYITVGYRGSADCESAGIAR